MILLKFLRISSRLNNLIMYHQPFHIESCKTCKTRTSSIFCCLKGELLEDLDFNKNCLIVKKGQVIFQENARPLGLFCVHKGKVKISKSGNATKDQIVRFAKNGDVIGYRSILSGEMYSANATALEDSELCFIPKDAFVRLIQSNSELAFNLMNLVAKDLKNAENKITELSQKPVRERIAEALLMLLEFYGTDSEGSIDIVLTREDLAGIVGTATETLIRIISDFKNDMIIESIGKKIKVINKQKLIQIAELYD